MVPEGEHSETFRIPYPQFNSTGGIKPSKSQSQSPFLGFSPTTPHHAPAKLNSCLSLAGLIPMGLPCWLPLIPRCSPAALPIQCPSARFPANLAIASSLPGGLLFLFMPLSLDIPQASASVLWAVLPPLKVLAAVSI